MFKKTSILLKRTLYDEEWYNNHKPHTQKAIFTQFFPKVKKEKSNTKYETSLFNLTKLCTQTNNRDIHNPIHLTTTLTTKES